MLHQCLRHLWRARRCPTSPLPSTASLHTFAENDFAVLRPKINRTDRSLFIGPLKAGKRLETHKGFIAHDDIISQSARSLVSTQVTKAKRVVQYRLHEATLEDYVRLTRRLVTPIYPSDAHLIVDLFDFHPEPFDASKESVQEPSITILEAGTGHGALTLYLSRAVHAANSPVPIESTSEDSESYEARLEAWKKARRALIHTVDVSATYSKHASQIVKGFRRGMYRANADFHVTDVGSWIEKALAERDGQSFLTHAFLDLPSTEKHIEVVAKALNVDGTLIVFTPSITQITELMLKVKKEGIALELEKVVELGVNGGSGGREWDVRPVRPRATIKALGTDEVGESSDTLETGGDEDSTQVSEALPAEGEDTRTDYSDGTWSTVCRPKVGDRIVGGGFLALYKKQQSQV